MYYSTVDAVNVFCPIIKRACVGCECAMWRVLHPSDTMQTGQDKRNYVGYCGLAGPYPRGMYYFPHTEPYGLKGLVLTCEDNPGVDWRTPHHGPSDSANHQA